MPLPNPSAPPQFKVEIPASRWTPSDRILLAALRVYGAFTLVALALTPVRFLPAEDAVILYQYSRNFAATGIISFNPDGPRVEGATDFAWMLLVALANRAGVSSFWFCSVASAICLAALAIVLCRIAGVKPSAGRILAVAGFAGLLPQIFAAASGFAVLPDALALTILVLLRRRRPGPFSPQSPRWFCACCDRMASSLPFLCWLACSLCERRGQRVCGRSRSSSSFPEQSISPGDGGTLANSSRCPFSSSPTPIDS